MDRCFEFRSGHGGTIRSPGTTEYPVGPLFEKKYQTGGGKRLCLLSVESTKQEVESVYINGSVEGNGVIRTPLHSFSTKNGPVPSRFLSTTLISSTFSAPQVSISWQHYDIIEGRNNKTNEESEKINKRRFEKASGEGHKREDILVFVTSRGDTRLRNSDVILCHRAVILELRIVGITSSLSLCYVDWSMYAKILSPSSALKMETSLGTVKYTTKVVSGERPYKCHLPECGRAFIQLSNLQQHLRNHDAQVERAKNRPFHCNICGKGFATESSLRTHTSKVGTKWEFTRNLTLRKPIAIGCVENVTNIVHISSRCRVHLLVGNTCHLKLCPPGKSSAVVVGKPTEIRTGYFPIANHELCRTASSVVWSDVMNKLVADSRQESVNKRAFIESEIGVEGDWILLTQDRDRWKALINFLKEVNLNREGRTNYEKNMSSNELNRPIRVRPSSCVLSQELQLRVPVLQQHAALIGGPNATSCPICHKLFLGGEALMEHMKHTHKDPNASGVARTTFIL
ncbi:hypothetical protein L798_02046 [Zootermopsis nevadensis]|uniref:C2H2-type domain-containing protein n=1 Tax=Zootermopsis nevadensis TaxID=136037 RepID=A0A067QSF1_ZOONE|nr:hypothetical protein L798_02046 [Zootermopsis nevadensis]